MLRIGVIGCGARAAWVMSCLRAADAEVTLGVVADPTPQLARRRLDDAKVPYDRARFVDDLDALLDHAGELDGLLIGTRCNLHAPIAIKVAPAGLPLFLEKPVAITIEQLRELNRAYLGREESVVVSFPLRMTPMFRSVIDIVRSGRLGTINQVQATNYVPYGGVYFAQWYRDFSTNGGLWLQKATHDFDCINQIVAAAPAAVVATSTRKIFGGTMPAEMHCSICPQATQCPESPASIAARDDDGGMGRDDHACVFSESIQHHDAGSALILYRDGTHGAYSQNFVTRRSAAARGARITGYLATLTYDFYSESIRVIEHHGKAVQDISVKVPDGHHGGDSGLARNFIEILRGQGVSRSTLYDGMLSASMCLAARESEATSRVEQVELPRRLTPPRVEVSFGAASSPLPVIREKVG